MLAGKMKLRNFVLLAVVVMGMCGVGGVAVVGLGLFELDQQNQALFEHVDQSTATPAPAAQPTPTTTVVVPAAEPAATAPVQASANAAALEPWAKVVFDNKGRNLGSDKLKDVSKGQSWKVNLYQDAGKTSMNRAKVDLDRDDKWDEKYTIDGDAVTRQVAPGDDENYTETYLWTGSAWARQ